MLQVPARVGLVDEQRDCRPRHQQCVAASDATALQQYERVIPTGTRRPRPLSLPAKPPPQSLWPITPRIPCTRYHVFGACMRMRVVVCDGNPLNGGDGR